jgi:hypothetical protein
MQVLATSGIEKTIKLWDPSEEAPNSMKRKEDLFEKNKERVRQCCASLLLMNFAAFSQRS